MRAFTTIASVLFLTLLINPQAYAFGKKATPSSSPVPATTPIASVSPAPSPAATVSSSAPPAVTASPSSKSWYKTPYGVDLSACDGPIENQQTPWCTAFSIVGVLETMLCDHVRLSIHHAWSMYEEYSVDEASAKVPGHKITTWDEWTESASKPKSDYLSFAKHQLNGMREIDSDDDISEVFKILDSGRPVYMGLAVPADLASCYENVRATTKITSGGHAIEVIGYGIDPRIPGGAFIRIKQSWGTDCGDKGYQNIPVSVCNLKGMYCIFFEPLSVS